MKKKSLLVIVDLQILKDYFGMKLYWMVSMPYTMMEKCPTFQETYLNRCEEKHSLDDSRARMVSSILEKFPCLEFGLYILEELALILKKSKSEMKRLAHDGHLAMSILVKMTSQAALKHQVRLLLTKKDAHFHAIVNWFAPKAISGM